MTLAVWSAWCRRQTGFEPGVRQSWRERLVAGPDTVGPAPVRLLRATVEFGGALVPAIESKVERPSASSRNRDISASSRNHV